MGTAKFALKTAVLGVLVSVFLWATWGIVSARRQLHASMAAAHEQNVGRFTLARRALEAGMRIHPPCGTDCANQNLRNLVKELDCCAPPAPGALYDGDAAARIAGHLPACFTPEDVNSLLAKPDGAYVVRGTARETYMLLSAAVQLPEARPAPVYYTQAFNISHLYAQHHRRLALCLWLAVLAGMGTAVFAFAALHTARRMQNRCARLAEAAGEATQLHRRLAEQEHFAAAFIHEIKTPATAILGYAELLRDAPCDEAARRTYADVIVHEGNRLAALSQKLLALVSLEGGRVQLGTVEAADFMRTLAPKLASALPGCRLEAHAEAACLYADADLLASLLCNLAVNAARAAPKDGAVHISGTALPGGAYRFTVADNGCGIPAAALPHVCRLFYSADKSRSRAAGGAGIGLYLCGKIADAHSGRLGIHSAEGEGTTVHFVLHTRPCRLLPPPA